jgi:hypothetical protein
LSSIVDVVRASSCVNSHSPRRRRHPVVIVAIIVIFVVVSVVVIVVVIIVIIVIVVGVGIISMGGVGPLWSVIGVYGCFFLHQ